MLVLVFMLMLTCALRSDQIRSNGSGGCITNRPLGPDPPPDPRLLPHWQDGVAQSSLFTSTEKRNPPLLLTSLLKPTCKASHIPNKKPLSAFSYIQYYSPIARVTCALSHYSLQSKFRSCPGIQASATNYVGAISTKRKLQQPEVR